MGGAKKGKWGREVESKAIVAVAAEEDGKGVGRIRLRRIADVSAESLLPFVREAAVPGTHIHSDGWKGYAGLGQALRSSPSRGRGCCAVYWLPMGARSDGVT